MPDAALVGREHELHLAEQLLGESIAAAEPTRS
jgi:hypothetical protein